jgi:hypothetical protein
MNRVVIVALFSLLSLTAACGFGFGDDLGSPTPSADYWGWLCQDGSTPDPDAGCLPASCDDGSTPSEPDGGEDTCVCADGTLVLTCNCQAAGCPDEGN